MRIKLRKNDKMLILTRKTNQKLIINDDIEVVILETYKNTVKIGVNAPRGVQIFREEVYREIKKSNQQAMVSSANIVDNIKPINAQKVSFDVMKKIQKND